MLASHETVYLSRAQVREIDRRAIEEYHIPSIVLMENAARGVTEVAMRMCPSPRSRVAIICGRGNNGGDGLAIARHLHNRGALVRIIIVSEHFTGDALVNWNIVQAMKIPRHPAANASAYIDPRATDLVIDALFGTGLSRAPQGEAATLVELMNHSRLPILAVDVPSGLDCNTGRPLGACVRATETVTFVALKTGFFDPAAKPYLGSVTVADIGCPIELIEAVRST